MQFVSVKEMSFSSLKTNFCCCCCTMKVKWSYIPVGISHNFVPSLWDICFLPHRNPATLAFIPAGSLRCPSPCWSLLTL